VTIRQLSLGGIPAVSLSNHLLELIVAPTLGMKVTNLRRRRGREWLWRNPDIPYRPGVYGGSYIETADSGGWDECFPTVQPSLIPGAPDGTPPLPDHGELWCARWESRVYEHAVGSVIAGTARGIALPYEFTREITLSVDEPTAVFRYRLRHTGDRPFPWIWAAHPVFGVRPGMRIVLPTVTQVRLAEVVGRTDWEVGQVRPWPLDGAGDAFVFPDAGGWAAMASADIGASGRVLLEDPEAGEWADLLMEPAEVPQLGLWLNCGGRAAGAHAPYYNCALEPAIGVPGRLQEAAGEGGLAPSLHPGEERVWRVTVGLWNEED
jgi:hypothetical protein